MSAGLSASIVPSADFNLTIAASSEAETYIPAVRNGLFSVLLGQSSSPILGCTVTFDSLQAHPIESSYAAFFMVAKEATEQLLGLTEGFEHNVAW